MQDQNNTAMAGSDEKVFATDKLTPCFITQTDQSLDETAALFERVQRMAKVGVWTLKIPADILYWTQELFSIFEIDPDRFEPSYDFFISAIHPDEQETFNSAYMASLDNNLPFNIEHRLLMNDGRIKYVRIECETCCNDDGKPLISYGTVRDITDLKTLELEKEKQRELLLQQSKLAQMGEMLDTIAHQWKQPLYQINSILPGLQRHYAERTLTAEELESKFDEIEMLTAHMAQTVERFRHFLHPQHTAARQFDLSDALRGALALIQSELDRLMVRYELDIENDYIVTGNKEEFEQALLSIIGNALDCFQHRTVSDPRLRFSIHQHGSDINVCIFDNAGGILDQFINKIFDLYFTTKIKGHGTGLGLYIAKMLIGKSMKGTITAGNTSEGAVFTIFLPAGEQAL